MPVSMLQWDGTRDVCAPLRYPIDVGRHRAVDGITNPEWGHRRGWELLGPLQDLEGRGISVGGVLRPPTG